MWSQYYVLKLILPLLSLISSPTQFPSIFIHRVLSPGLSPVPLLIPIPSKVSYLLSISRRLVIKSLCSFLSKQLLTNSATRSCQNLDTRRYMCIFEKGRRIKIDHILEKRQCKSFFFFPFLFIHSFFFFFFKKRQIGIFKDNNINKEKNMGKSRKG